MASCNSAAVAVIWPKVLAAYSTLTHTQCISIHCIVNCQLKCSVPCAIAGASPLAATSTAVTVAEPVAAIVASPAAAAGAAVSAAESRAVLRAAYTPVDRSSLAKKTVFVPYSSEDTRSPGEHHDGHQGLREGDARGTRGTATNSHRLWASARGHH